jgi:DMSO/TMAO reductase YedYZ molybdopterin-dependent catalytic subunit
MIPHHRLFAACATLSLVMATHALAGQSTSGTVAAPAKLEISGDVRSPLSLMADELKAMPRTRVELKGEDGRTTAYEGVLVADLLRRAGAPLGNDLRGAALATYVMATASDGYQVLFSLAELDPAMTNRQVIVADVAEGKALAPQQGPLRIVMPGDVHPTRSVRMLVRLEVIRLKK